MPCSLAVPPLLLGMQVGFLWISFIFDSETMLSTFIFPLVSHISGGLHPTPSTSELRKGLNHGPQRLPTAVSRVAVAVLGLRPRHGTGHRAAPEVWQGMVAPVAMVVGGECPRK